MKFFVYTIEYPGAQHADPRAVNAQPLREILSMMLIRSGEIYLALPRITDHSPAQGGVFPVSAWRIADDLPGALALTGLSKTAFKRVAQHAVEHTLTRFMHALQAEQSALDKIEETFR